MKKIVLFSGILLISLFLSCYESFLNHSEKSSSSEKGKSSSDNNPISSLLIKQKGEINLSREVIDPVRGECSINGKVKYMHNTLRNSVKNRKLKVKLELNAELCNKLLNPMKQNIYGKSIDTVCMNEKEEAVLDKSYSVLYRPDLKISVHYLVTPESIGIAQLTLHQMAE